MASPRSAVGERLGSYQILSELGSGGMGRVYRAKDVKLGRLVALKLLQVHFEADSQMVGRFQREAHVWPACITWA